MKEEEFKKKQIYGKLTLGVTILCLVSLIVLGILTGLAIVKWWTLIIPIGVMSYWFIGAFGLMLIYIADADKQ